MNSDRLDLIRSKSKWAKRKALEMCANAGKGHLTSALSCAEILATLYYGVMRVDPRRPDWDGRDRFIMSKNHAALMQYPILADLGFFPQDELATFLCGSEAESAATRIGTHSKLGLPGIDFSGGSLGIGIGVAAGLAYGLRASGNPAAVFCLIGDGECYEGSVWEAAMFAAHNGLPNLTVIIDRNKMAVTDFTENMLRLEPLADKWISFGFDVRQIDGHDIGRLLAAFTDKEGRDRRKPLAIIADTVKGKGVDFLENACFRHGVAPKPNEIEAAMLSLDKEVIV
jgi:transketolase